MTEVSARGGGSTNKPSAVYTCNSAKSFIDVSDQMSSYSTALRRTIKCFRKIAVQVPTDTAVVKSCYLYKDIKKASMHIKTFRGKYV